MFIGSHLGLEQGKHTPAEAPWVKASLKVGKLSLNRDVSWPLSIIVHRCQAVTKETVSYSSYLGCFFSALLLWQPECQFSFCKSTWCLHAGPFPAWCHAPAVHGHAVCCCVQLFVIFIWVFSQLSIIAMQCLMRSSTKWVFQVNNSGRLSWFGLY